MIAQFMMVSAEDLEFFNLFEWLGTGQRAAGLGHCNQSTIGRGVGRLRGVFGGVGQSASRLGLAVSSRQVLTMERSVHQLGRFLRQSRLRLQATHWTNRLIQSSLPSAWLVNPLPCIQPRLDGLERLDCHAIDAILTEGIQRPADDDPRYQCFDLYRSSVQPCPTPEPAGACKWLEGV